MMINRFISKIVGGLFMLFGIGMSSSLVYLEGPWFVRQFTWQHATAFVDDIKGEGSETTLTLTIVEEDGSSRVVDKDYEITEEDDIFIGKSLQALYHPSDESSVYVYDHPWWGFLVFFCFSLVFAIVGFFLISLKAQRKFNEWNHDYRFYWMLLLIVGLLTLSMAIDPAEASPDSIVQSEWGIRFLFILIGLPITIIGGYGLYSIVKKKQIRNPKMTE